MGAERAGNPEGTIPAWTGGITAPPPGYGPAMHHPDPYAGDRMLYTVTAADLDARGALLCDGQKALLRAHPESWRMNVYPTRRSASFPDVGLRGRARQRDAGARGARGKGIGRRRARGPALSDSAERRRGDLEPQPALARRAGRSAARGSPR